MKKFLVYGLVTAVIGGIGVAFNSWEYKGDIKVRDFNAPPKVNREVLESDKKPMIIPIKEGQTLTLDMANKKVNLKYHNQSTTLISSVEDRWTFKSNESGYIIGDTTDASDVYDHVTITLPKNANFNLDIKTNDSNVFGEIDNINNLDIESKKGFVDMKINKVNNIDIETGYGNIGLAINEVNGQIIGNVGVGSVNFDIENEEKINLKGYKVYSDKIVKVDETNKGNQNVNIKGDLAKVIFY
ncbi:MAG: hypothetical protein ACRCTZ_21290 [Sarcina sp.]